MNCPRCGCASSVLDKRKRDQGAANWRRRQCEAPTCAHRFSTLEFETVKAVCYVPKAQTRPNR